MIKLLYASKEPIAIRSMKDNEQDFTTLHNWLTDANVLSYIEGPGTKYTMDNIIAKYGPRTKEASDVKACIIEFEGRHVGYLQFYKLTQDDIKRYDAGKDTLPYGIDIFIGEHQYWNQGIGTLAMKCMLKYLVVQCQSGEIYVDPQIRNERAIKSYEKCGFQKVKILKNHELFDGTYQDNQLMRLSSQDFMNSQNGSE
ncbi:GNAT family N-acetyltransferase [Paenibacillus pinihumi]|uniref:GNAT family N-acetyltransferase n=1 Tax=Paenibacillus pinihumi TaxID=669462 RepID=UPI00137884DE|nr:GNAT family N-acetyltransferase [Paenibacillus pinihumi]